MKVKRMVKRLFAVGTGVAMLGATAMGAVAADLSEYPSMFVDNGVFNGLLVVGENAKPIDNLAMTDIAASMKVSSGSGTTVSVSGDSWSVGTSVVKMELANNNASASTVAGENVRDIATFIDNVELSALADGSWETNENEYTFQQFLYFDNKGTNPERSRLVKYAENGDDVTADHFFIASGTHIARYLMEFGSAAQSDVTDSSGTADTTGTYLDDFEGTELSMLGKTYSVVLARRPAAGPQGGGRSVKLTLMAGAARDTILEGEAKTYTVKDTTYEVSLTFTDADEAKFVVNGESTSKLKAGETFVLSDGSEIGVTEVLYQAYAGGVHSATFFVGAQKTELRDDDTSDGISTHDLKIGSETIDGSDVIIVASDDNTTVGISTITINMSAEDNYFVGAGQKLTDVIMAAGEEKEVLTWGDLDFEYHGLTDEDSHDLRLKTTGSRTYAMRLFDADGNAVDIPTAYAEGTDNLSLGDDTWAATNARGSQKRLIMTEGTAGAATTNAVGGDNIYKSDYLVLTSGTAASGTAKSYLLQYKGADRQSKTSPKIQFKNVGSGETLDLSVSTVSAGSTGTVATIKLGGYSFIVQNASSVEADDFQIDVDLDGGGAIGTNTVNFVDSYGSQWAMTHNVTEGNTTHTEWVEWRQSTPNTNDYDTIIPTAVVLNITSVAGPELRAALTGMTLQTPEGETEVSYGYTSMGTFVRLDEPASDPDELTMTYPSAQRLPQVYLTSGSTRTTTSAGGTKTAVEVVDATRLDSEVASVSAQNLIVVGGPCVNTVAAELMGSPADCAEGFTPGKSRVKLFEHANGNMAMLVAGYSGADTRLAGKIVANRPGDLFGSEVEVEGTTSSDATVSAAN